MASMYSDSEPNQPSSPTGDNKSTPSSPLDRESLLLAVRKQVEYYFSKENLQNDAFLTSQMDASNSVSIAVVMKFSKMKSLVNGDESLLRDALRDSQVCPVTEDGRIKAVAKVGGRSTIILRDITSDTPEAAIREIFNYDGCKRIVSIRSDIENTWFVEMDSETDAKDTLLDIKLKRRMFNGETVKARLKTEVAVRSFYSQPQSVVPVGGMLGYPGIPMNGMPISPYGASFGNVSPMSAGNVLPAGVYAYGMPPIDHVMIAGTAQMMINPDGPRGGGGSSYGGPMSYKQDYPMSMDGGHSRNNDQLKHPRGKASDSDRNGMGRMGPSSGNSSIASSRSGDNRGGQSNSLPYPPQNSGNGGGGVGRGPLPKTSTGGSPNSAVRGNNPADVRAGAGAARQTKSKGPQSKVPASSSQSAPAPVDLTLQNFPPLHVDETPVPTAGYQGKYQKYTADEIIAIVSQVKDAPLPISALDGRVLVPSEHSHAMNSTPNMDLLKRQRSFSIDETREQLQQGRPVQREAVGTGAVDYHSMYYGDDRSASIDESSSSGLVSAEPLVPAQPVGASSRDNSGAAAAAAANRPRSNSGSIQTKVSITQSAASGKTSVNSQQLRGSNAVPSASTWAQLVGASVSTQTEVATPASPPRTGAPAASSATAAASKPAAAAAPKAVAAAAADGKISKDSANTKGTSAGPAAGGKSAEGRSRSGSSGSMGGKGRQAQGQGPAQGHKKKDAKPTEASESSPSEAPVSPTTGKPSFASILRQQSAGGTFEAAPSPAATAPAPSGDAGDSARGNRARSGSKDKTSSFGSGSGSSSGARGGSSSSGVGGGQGERRQAAPASISTEADGSWARKTLN